MIVRTSATWLLLFGLLISASALPRDNIAEKEDQTVESDKASSNEESDEDMGFNFDLTENNDDDYNDEDYPIIDLDKIFEEDESTSETENENLHRPNTAPEERPGQVKRDLRILTKSCNTCGGGSIKFGVKRTQIPETQITKMIYKPRQQIVRRITATHLSSGGGSNQRVYLRRILRNYIRKGGNPIFGQRYVVNNQGKRVLRIRLRVPIPTGDGHSDFRTFTAGYGGKPLDFSQLLSQTGDTSHHFGDMKGSTLSAKLKEMLLRRKFETTGGGKIENNGQSVNIAEFLSNLKSHSTNTDATVGTTNLFSKLFGLITNKNQGSSTNLEAASDEGIANGNVLMLSKLLQSIKDKHIETSGNEDTNESSQHIGISEGSSSASDWMKYAKLFGMLNKHKTDTKSQADSSLGENEENDSSSTETMINILAKFFAVMGTSKGEKQQVFFKELQGALSNDKLREFLQLKVKLENKRQLMLLQRFAKLRRELATCRANK